MFRFPEIALDATPKSPITSLASRPIQRGVGHRHNEGRVAVDADVAIDGRGKGVRRKRVVLAPVTASSSEEANASEGRRWQLRPSHRGERVISRKATAQGMSDALRCPVCSCAAFFALFAHETAGAARIRHSPRPLFSRARNDMYNSGALRRGNVTPYLPISTSSLRTQGPITTGSNCFACWS